MNTLYFENAKTLIDRANKLHPNRAELNSKLFYVYKTVKLSGELRHIDAVDRFMYHIKLEDDTIYILATKELYNQVRNSGVFSRMENSLSEDVNECRVMINNFKDSSD